MGKQLAHPFKAFHCLSERLAGKSVHQVGMHKNPCIPAGLNERILQRTIWADRRSTEPERRSWASVFGEWVRGIRMPVPVPQLAPVALMLTFGFLFISQSVSADGSLTDVYNKSVQIAEQTYRQSAEAFSRTPSQLPAGQAPANAAEGTK